MATTLSTSSVVRSLSPRARMAERRCERSVSCTAVSLSSLTPVCSCTYRKKKPAMSAATSAVSRTVAISESGPMPAVRSTSTASKATRTTTAVVSDIQERRCTANARRSSTMTRPAMKKAASAPARLMYCSISMTVRPRWSADSARNLGSRQKLLRRRPRPCPHRPPASYFRTRALDSLKRSTLLMGMPRRRAMRVLASMGLGSAKWLASTS